MKATFTIMRPFSGLLCLLCIAMSSLFITGCVDDELIEPASIATPSSAVGDAVSISNPGLESGETGWNFVDPFAISGSSNSGSRSGKITGSGGKLEQTLSINSNTNYTLSAYILDNGTIGASVGGSSYEEGGDYSDWTQVSVSFNSGSSSSVTIYGEYNGGEGRFDDFTLIEGEGGSSSSYTSVPALIQAEDYDDATEGRTQTQGSEVNVGWIDSGESLSYNVSVPSTGTYAMDFNVASLVNTIEFDIYQGNSKIGSFSESSTGGWANWTTTSASTSVNLTAGDQVIKLVATGGGWNINWLEVKSGSSSSYTSVPALIQAEDYDDATEGRTQTQGSEVNVGWIDSGESLSYNVSVPSTGTYAMDFNVASLVNTIKFDIYQGDSKIGSFSESSTGGWANWTTTSASASVNLTAGDQVIKLVATGGGWNINWLEVKEDEDEPVIPGGPLDPNKNPSENFDLSQWKLTISSGADIDISVLNDGYELSNQFYTDPSDGGMVFKNYPAGSGTGTTSGATQYSRVELRELLGGENSTVSETQLNENNWVFGSSGDDAKDDAGGVDGVLTATLKVDRVTTSADGSDTKVGRIVIGQIHASKNEPIRLYYKLMPGTTKGAIYFVHEDASGNEFAVNMIGDYSKTGSGNAGDFSGASEPSDGIPFGEVFSYKIEVVNNMLYVDIIRDGRSTVSEEYDMVNSDYEDDWMYFKAGLYSQNDQAESSSDYEQVTFYSVENTH